MKIKIGNSLYTATLYENETAAAFNSLLPLILYTRELDGNEKFADLSRRFPNHASNPGTIQKGELMLYGSSTLVLFYKSFSTSSRYTKPGFVDEPAGPGAAPAAGDKKKL